ncbi:MAG: branched-chain-amino-acid transaminase [Candidatus Eremiobacteraeota bacterium]|nr:branched-chain-amino-acid transaminase [Candidatus Eremiobacteraeota bacterium]
MAVVYIDGKFYDNKDDAKISVWDHGFLYGDGIFEGIRVYNGLVFKLDEHLDRLYDSAKTLAMKIPLNFEELKEVTLETIRRTKEKDCYIRLIISRGKGDLGIDPRKCPKATVVIIVDTIKLFPEELYDVGVDVIIASTRKNVMDALNPNVKSLNYLNNIMAKIEAVHAGVPEAILVNAHGHITEGTADNIFIIKNGVLKTPPAYAGILVGITRNLIMDIARSMNIPVQETLMTAHDLFIADEIFLSGTAAEMIPVIKVNQRVINDGKPGPIFRKLLEGLRAKTKVEGTPVYSKEQLNKMAKV